MDNAYPRTPVRNGCLTGIGVMPGLSKAFIAVRAGNPVGMVYHF
jgi:hypothetical protein